ncbi:heparinase II/III-family protein [Bacillus cereus]
MESKAFSSGGYYILRNEDVYCCIRCGELSFRGQGAHSHNDQLSFTLSVTGEDIFIDSGTFTYTADYKMRNLFRSTSVHNTLEIPPYEQNDFEKYHLFEMAEQSFSKGNYFKDSKFVGQHRGYLKNVG